MLLSTLRIVVDVQHLYRPAKPLDRGAVYTLANGTRTDEASATLLYAASMRKWLAAQGASVLFNDPARGVLVGPYSRRNREAFAFRANAYLACHLNSGGGAYGMAEYMGLGRGQALAEMFAARLPALEPRIATARAKALTTTERGAVCIREVPGSCAAVLLEPFFGDYRPHQSLLAAPELHHLGEMFGHIVADWWDASRSAMAATAE